MGHRLAYMLSQSHCNVEWLCVYDRDYLKTAETQDIITLWDHVQKWRVYTKQGEWVVMDKSKGVENVLLLVLVLWGAIEQDRIDRKAKYDAEKKAAEEKRKEKE